MYSTIQSWKKVSLYYLLACAFSWPFFWWRDIHPESWKALSIPAYVKIWPYMCGPGLSAIICFYLFGTSKRTITFFGTSIFYSLIAYLIFVISMVIISPATPWNIFFTFGLITHLGEELGWRGWLQNHLKIESPIKKSLAIGVLWELWHFTNRTTQGPLLTIIIRVCAFIIFCSFFSYVMLKVTERTKSLMWALIIHMAINISFEGTTQLIAVTACLPFWAWLIWKWPKTSITEEKKL